jgi:hypothetical protein
MQHKDTELSFENTGIQVIESEFMKIICFQTLTKLKFIFVVNQIVTVQDCESMFKRIYDIYSDYVSKNPFYELDMPIRIETFDNEINKLI